MGLDIFFHRHKVVESKGVYKEEVTEVAYFRGCSFLLEHFNYGDSYSERHINYDDIDSLLEKCKTVLENHDLAQSVLPDFFRSYDDSYFEDVREVMCDMVEVLTNTDFENEYIVMWCSW